jgi:hypothetical protein
VHRERRRGQYGVAAKVLECSYEPVGCHDPDRNHGCTYVLDGISIKVEVETDAHIPDGIAGLSWLSGSMPYISIPGMGKLIIEPDAT